MPNTATRGATGGSLGLTLIAILAPKCPGCIVGYLAYVGLGAGTASFAVAQWRPIFLALAGLSLLAAGFSYVRPRGRRCVPARRSLK